MSSHTRNEQPTPELQLGFLQARILGVLVEKERATPDVYPLTLNSLTTGCNQKSARDPIINATESEVQVALDQLRRQVLVLETYGASGRVLRYAHNAAKVYGLPSPSVALLAVLVLRGALTASELRASSERLYHFDDTASVEAYLDEMAIRSAGPLVCKLPKQAGARELRWAHLLCGPVATDKAPQAVVHRDPVSLLEERVSQLEREVASLKERFAPDVPGRSPEE